MSSVNNYSVSQLREILTARGNHLTQVHDRIDLQETRLLQRPDQTGVLTTEQQTLNQRFVAVRNDYVATGKVVIVAFCLLEAYGLADPNDQPRLRDQIRQLLLALFANIAVQIENIEDKVRELEGIDVTDAQ